MERAMMNGRYVLTLLILGLVSSSGARAADIFQGANLDTGRKLAVENQCNGSCHQKFVPGQDPSAIFFRNPRKVHNAPELLDQVRRCTIKLNLSVFPDDVKDIAAALNADFYHFE
jgi:hypothetical protein